MTRSRFTLIPLTLSALLGGMCALAGTTTLYRTVDENGVIQYSDRPSPGATKVSVTDSPVTTSSRPAAPYTSSSAQSRAGASPLGSGYSSCEVDDPKPEQVLFDTQTVTVHLRLVPEPRPGVSTTLNFDGSDIDGAGTTFTLNPVYRGAHTVGAVIRDATGSVACTTPSITFYVRDASLVAPNHSGGQPMAPVAPAAPLAPGVPHN